MKPDSGAFCVPTLLCNWLLLFKEPQCFTCFPLQCLAVTSNCSAILINSSLFVSLLLQLQTNRHDNAYHDKATDSLVNYETVKYFANEDWERKRYVKSISDYQKFTVATQASLSLLNLSQQVPVEGVCCLFMVVVDECRIFPFAPRMALKGPRWMLRSQSPADDG